MFVSISNILYPVQGLDDPGVYQRRHRGYPEWDITCFYEQSLYNFCITNDSKSFLPSWSFEYLIFFQWHDVVCHWMLFLHSSTKQLMPTPTYPCSTEIYSHQEREAAELFKMSWNTWSENRMSLIQGPAEIYFFRFDWPLYWIFVSPCVKCFRNVSEKQDFFWCFSHFVSIQDKCLIKTDILAYDFASNYKTLKSSTAICNA